MLLNAFRGNAFDFCCRFVLSWRCSSCLWISGAAMQMCASAATVAFRGSGASVEVQVQIAGGSLGS